MDWEIGGRDYGFHGRLGSFQTQPPPEDIFGAAEE